MSNNRNHLPDEWNEIFVNRVRSIGVWCDNAPKAKYRHYFICRNEKATVAISLCGQIVAPFEKLHENLDAQKCLICELYNTGREEVKDKILLHHDQTISQLTQTQNTKQE